MISLTMKSRLDPECVRRLEEAVSVLDRVVKNTPDESLIFHHGPGVTGVAHFA